MSTVETCGLFWVLLALTGCGDSGTNAGGAGGQGNGGGEASGGAAPAGFNEFETAYCETRLTCRGAAALEAFYGAGTFDACFEGETSLYDDDPQKKADIAAASVQAIEACSALGEVCLAQGCLDCVRDLPMNIDTCVADAQSYVDDICPTVDECPGLGEPYP